MADATIHTAYSVSTRHGEKHYSVVAVVRDKGFRSYNSRTGGYGETLEAAERDALDYLAACYRRQGLTPPTEIVKYGRVAHSVLTNVAFFDHRYAA